MLHSLGHFCLFAAVGLVCCAQLHISATLSAQDLWQALNLRPEIAQLNVAVQGLQLQQEWQLLRAGKRQLSRLC